jgi:hypothetical protein
VLPIVFDKRTAISGEIPALPLIRLDSLERDTFSIFAAAVTVNSSSSIELLTILPGCTGFFRVIMFFPSMIIYKVNVESVSILARGWNEPQRNKGHKD